MTPRLKLLLLLTVLASPFFASYLTYYFWKPTGAMNYGELLPTKPLPVDELRSVEGAGGESGLKGKWVLLTVDSGKCEETCTQKLYMMRQVRVAQGKHMDRLVRALVVDDGVLVSQQLMKEYDGTIILKGQDHVLRHLPATSGTRNHIFLLDPLGNLVLRYPSNPDPKRMIKDLTRLLTVSKLG